MTRGCGADEIALGSGRIKSFERQVSAVVSTASAAVPEATRQSEQPYVNSAVRGSRHRQRSEVKAGIPAFKA